VLGWGAATAVVLTVYDFTGGSLKGFKRDTEIDEFERKQYLRKNRRRPIEETIAELGEGPSELSVPHHQLEIFTVTNSCCPAIHAPGYEERRRQRVKEAYGFDVNPVSTDPNAA
jgi:hypothetical protein